MRVQVMMKVTMSGTGVAPRGGTQVLCRAGTECHPVQGGGGRASSP